VGRRASAAISLLAPAGTSGDSALGDVEATIADQLADLLSGFMALFGLRTELAEPASQSMVGMVEHTIAWWMKGRKVSRDELVQHLRFAIWTSSTASCGDRTSSSASTIPCRSSTKRDERSREEPAAAARKAG